MRSVSVLALGAAFAFAAASPASAAPIFSDWFDGYAPSLGWNGSGAWSTNSVDLVQSGTFSLTCAGGAGNCVDLSGSAPGVISKTINLAAGTYTFAFDYTGNQLNGDGGGPYTEAGFTASAGSLVQNLSGLSNSSSLFQTFSQKFTHAGGDLTINFAQNGGNTYRGSILDNVSIAAVPEPSTWALMILGFGAIGGMLRRRARPAFA
jgi:hypothetical protein